MDQKIENVARAFYEAEDDAHAWEREPEILKEEFRRLAREAIALLEEDETEHGRGEATAPARYAA